MAGATILQATGPSRHYDSVCCKDAQCTISASQETSLRHANSNGYPDRSILSTVHGEETSANEAILCFENGVGYSNPSDCETVRSKGAAEVQEVCIASNYVGDSHRILWSAVLG